MSVLSVSHRCFVRIPYSMHGFHTCPPSYRQANVMKKLLKTSSKKRPIYSEAPTLPTPEVFSKGVFEGKKSGNSKRAAILNKLFMTHITDLMATGENADIYSGLGIEINKVQVTPDYKLIQVFWVAKGNETDEIINKLLTKNAGQLRHELTQLRVIGMVPKILFCKDKTLAILAEIDRKLNVADFGDDHVPVDLISKLKTELELNTSLAPDVKEKINKLEDEVLDDVPESAVPVMPQNVFGLNHADIMTRVIRGIKKAKADHRKEATSENNVLAKHAVNTNPIQFEGGMSQREALQKFLLKRQLERSRARRENKNYTPDAEYMRKEFEERYRNSLLQAFDEDADEKDYIEEYEEENNSYKN